MHRPLLLENKIDKSNNLNFKLPTDPSCLKTKLKIVENQQLEFQVTNRSFLLESHPQLGELGFIKVAVPVPVRLRTIQNSNYNLKKTKTIFFIKKI